MTPKNFNFQKTFYWKITLIAMIKKMPLTFLDVKKSTSYDLFYVCTSEAPQKWQGTILKKRRSFCWFSRNSEVEATWISLTGWPHKTSTVHVGCMAMATHFTFIHSLSCRYNGLHVCLSIQSTSKRGMGSIFSTTPLHI